MAPPTILRKILARKREEVSARRKRDSLGSLEQRITEQSPVRGFSRALQERAAAAEPAVIAEVKKASPSKGVIRADFQPAQIAASYQAGVSEHLPWAQVTFDEFHLIQLLNKAVDEVRRQEVKGAPQLRRTRYLWLKDKHAWSRQQILRFADIKVLNLKTHRAFRIKEALREIFRTGSGVDYYDGEETE